MGTQFAVEERSMNAKRWIVTGTLFLVTVGLAWPADRDGAPEKVGPDSRQWSRIVDKGIAYLRTTQGEDGSWAGQRSPGVTGVVLTGLLHTGRVTPEDPAAARA